MMLWFLLVLAIFLVHPAHSLVAQEDPYEQYVKTSRDFAPVKQDKAWLLRAWPGWIYMPWTYRWTLGYDNASGEWSIQHGYNGAFLDHGQTQVAGRDKLAWIDRFQLRFYVDHIAGKGDLHLWDSNEAKPFKHKIRSIGVRPQPLDEKTRARLEKRIQERINQVKKSPHRAAYALDDETSWGHFVAPCMWRLLEDRTAYENWLVEIYGKGKAPDHKGWISYDGIQPRLKLWKIRDFDCSQLMDQWTFNDAWWCNGLGDLVDYANRIDPATPCGIVGGQSPNAFGGYDYARMMRKIQFIEAYDLGSSQALIRSFNPMNAVPSVTTHFHEVNPENPLEVKDGVWQAWYYLAHGNRGMIGWVENWFDEKTQKPLGWHKAIAPSYIEAGQKIGPLRAGGEWIHDGVAIYYNHPSIQLGWILDAECHEKTWPNRNRDHSIGSSHLVRHAWENMLRDEGLQYDFISYVDVIQNGIPPEYKVLILPAVLCLSDVEAERIKKFCLEGGTVVADYLPGLWDQHGHGRKTGGILDDLFGVEHDLEMKAAHVFQKRLWVEVDQEENYYSSSFDEFLTRNNTCIRHENGYHKAVREMEVGHENHYGRGKAILMNLSPQWYNAFRAQGFNAAKNRSVVMTHLKSAGLERWVEVEEVEDKTHGYEITYWWKEGRSLVFVCFNPERMGASMNGSREPGIKADSLPIRIRFLKTVKDVRDERGNKDLGDGRCFEFEWKMNEALVLSFAGKPPR